MTKTIKTGAVLLLIACTFIPGCQGRKQEANHYQKSIEAFRKLRPDVQLVQSVTFDEKESRWSYEYQNKNIETALTAQGVSEKDAGLATDPFAITLIDPAAIEKLTAVAEVRQPVTVKRIGNQVVMVSGENYALINGERINQPVTTQ